MPAEFLQAVPPLVWQCAAASFVAYAALYRLSADAGKVCKCSLCMRWTGSLAGQVHWQCMFNECGVDRRRSGSLQMAWLHGARAIWPSRVVSTCIPAAAPARATAHSVHSHVLLLRLLLLLLLLLLRLFKGAPRAPLTVPPIRLHPCSDISRATGV
jgi:hypothetical protein